MPRGLLPLAFSFALVATAWTPVARAFCRSSTCEPDAFEGIQGAVCDPPTETDCGVPLVWDRDCIGFTVQEDGSDEIPLKTARALLAQSFATWENADCGASGPGIHIVDMGTVECDRVEYEPSTGNANILIFRDGDWLENGYDKLALTTVNYDKQTGEIFNADIEVNTADYDFIQGESGGDYDLVGVLTHEAGHFLGFAHSSDGQATMFDTYHEGMPDLADDDLIGICATYPPRNIDKDHCNPIPRHGFSPRCANQQTEGRCSIGSLREGELPSDMPLWPVAATLGLLWFRRRRERHASAG
ncbi:MAG: matrixin family metalloprotease [Polyangiaceae bacterium]